MTKTTTTIDAEAVRRLAAILEDSGLTELEYDAREFKVRLVKTSAPLQVVSAPLAPSSVVAPPAFAEGPAREPSSPALETHPGAVLAPMVGVVYHSPEPGVPPFIQTGSDVSEGQTLLLIEAMKTFNPVKAPRSGKVKAILCKDGEPVEYGQPLVVVE